MPEPTVKPLSTLLASLLSSALFAGCATESRDPEPSPWHADRTSLPFAHLIGPSLVPTSKGLWLLGGTGSAGFNREIWHKPADGSWTRISDTLPFAHEPTDDIRAVAFKDSLLIAKLRIRETESGAYILPYFYISGDGLTWRYVERGLFEAYGELNLVSTGDTVWQLAGYGEGGDSARWSFSTDAGGWYYFSTAKDQGPRGSLLACAWQGQVYALDSAKNGWLLKPFKPWTRTLDGPPELLSASDRSLGLASHGGTLYFFGGHVDIRGKYLDGSNQVWKSKDGKAWDLMDSHAPTGYRMQPGMASQGNRLWIVGGSASGPGSEWDAWYLEAGP